MKKSTPIESKLPPAKAETKGIVVNSKAAAERIASKYPSLMVIHVKETAKKVGN
jgi:hypothetical protein